MKFSIKDFFSKCDQICRKLRFWSHLLKKSLIENLIFCVVIYYFFKKSNKNRWYLFCRILSSFWCTRTTFATFQISGNFSCLSHCSNIDFIGIVISLLLTWTFWLISCLVGSIDFITASISFSEMLSDFVLYEKDCDVLAFL